MADPGHTIINRGIVTLGGSFVTPFNLLKLESMDWYAADDQTKEEIDALGINAALVNGLSVETAVPPGAVFTDTHVPVVNNLLSIEETMALSANMGRVLDEKISDAVTDITANYQDIQALQLDSHTHSNKTVIDNLGINADDELTYNGNKVDTVIAQRDVYNGLDSTDTTVSLAAAQGKVLNDKITANTSNIVTNTSNIGTNTTDIGTNTTNIATNATNITTNTSNIAANSAAITTLDSAVTTNTSAIAAANTAIADLQTDTHTHANKLILDKFGEDVSGLPTYNGNAIDTTIAQRDVYDGLDSADNTISLAASQGQILKADIDANAQQIATNVTNISNITAQTTALAADAHTHDNLADLSNIGSNLEDGPTWNGTDIALVNLANGMYAPMEPIQTVVPEYSNVIGEMNSSRLWIRIPFILQSHYKLTIQETESEPINNIDIVVAARFGTNDLRTVTNSDITVTAEQYTVGGSYMYLKLEHANKQRINVNTYGNIQAMVLLDAIPTVSDTRFYPLPFNNVQPAYIASVDRDVSTWTITTTPADLTATDDGSDPALYLYKLLNAVYTSGTTLHIVNDGFIEIIFGTIEIIKYAILTSAETPAHTVDLTIDISNDDGATWTTIHSSATYTLDLDINLSGNTAQGDRVRFHISNISDTTNIFTGIGFYFA